MVPLGLRGRVLDFPLHARHRLSEFVRRSPERSEELGQPAGAEEHERNRGDDQKLAGSNPENDAPPRSPPVRPILSRRPAQLSPAREGGGREVDICRNTKEP